MENKTLLGLIGYPLTHSFSAGYFSDKFKRENITDYEYRNFPLKNISRFRQLLKNNPGLCGLNVTIPYKEQIISYLDKLDSVAERIGAVNTVKFIRKGNRNELVGYNTDSTGFLKSLTPSLNSSHKRALILGTGGASKAVAFVLQELEIEFLFVTRNPKPGMITYRDLCLSIIRNHLLIINTTPLGTYPDVQSFPDIPYDLLTPGHIMYDLVYNPPETEFLRLGRQKGATCINGQRMLEIQAEKSWEIWQRP
jgi:shikimate dehydrogenase